MVEPGTYPDPDEPQALTPDAVYVPETGEEIHAPADPGPDSEVQAEGFGGVEGEAVAKSGALDRAMVVGAAVGRGAMQGVGLVLAYPRAAVATGLSVLVLCGVLSWKSRRAPELKLPTPEVSAASGETPTDPPAPTGEVKVADPGPSEKAEKVVAPAPVVPADDLAIPSPATASGDGVEQTVADLDAPDLPPEFDAKAVEPEPADDPLAPMAGMASSLLSFNDAKPEDAPAPAPAAEAPTIAPPKVESAPVPAPAPTPAAELPPETLPPVQAPAPSPAADLLAPAITADLPPVVSPTEPTAPPPASILPPPDPSPKDDPLAPAQAPPASPPTTPNDAAPVVPPTTAPALSDPVPAVAPVQPAAPEPPTASTQPPATLPQATTTAELPAFEPTPVSKPTEPAPAATSKPDGDWLPLKHSSGTPKLNPGDMDLTDEGFDSLSGRGEAFFRDLPPPSNPLPVRAAGAVGAGVATATAIGVGAGAAALAPDAPSAARRDEGRMDTILHKVQPGENFWTISRTHYASGRYYKALGKANSDQFQRLQDLYVGAVIRIPPPEDLDAALIEPPGGRSARNSDPDASESPAPQTASADAPRLRRARRLDGELNLPVSDPEAEQASDRDDRRRSTREEFEEPAPRRAAPVHKVRSRETLRSIARDRLGDSRRAREILELNRDAIPDPAHLPVGQVLDLPNDAE